MHSLVNIQQGDSSLTRFIRGDKVNRRYMRIILVASLVEFVVFKACYPFPDFFSDSYSYIYAASSNLSIGIWPIGYSKFLQWLHVLTHSDSIVVALQFALMQLSAAYFFFTVCYFYSPAKTTKLILFIFLFFNPFTLYLSNYINSDALFAALSLFWFTYLIWIINRPKKSQLLVQAVLVFLAFTVRNNAYYYPVLTALAFILSRQPARFKVIGMALPLALIIPFILFTRAAAKRMTGTAQYSLFTGWQIANNTLYMYGQIQVDSNLFTTPETKELNRICKGYFAPMTKDYYNYLYDYPANFFIVDANAPLKKYFDRYDSRSMRRNTVSWGKVSPIYETFGKTLLKHYPGSYVRYFMIPNIKNYFCPTLEKLALYNLGDDHVYPLAARWFDFRSTRVTSINKHFQGIAQIANPVLFLLANAYFLGGLVYYAASKKYKKEPASLNRAFVLAAAFWLLNFGFSIFATIIIFRYHAFPFVVIFGVSVILLETLMKPAPAGQKEKRETKPFVIPESTAILTNNPNA